MKPDWAIIDSLRGQFFKKVAQILLGFYKKYHFLSKNCCAYFLRNHWKNMGYLFFQHLVTLRGVLATPGAQVRIQTSAIQNTEDLFTVNC